MTLEAAPASRPGDRLFYGGMALAIAATVFAGFSATFYSRAGTLPALSPLLIVHGIVFTSWILIFITQTSLISARRVDLHRRLGVGAAVLAAAMVVVGVTAAVDALRRGAAPLPGIDPRMFFAVPIGDMIVFSILVGAGILNRANSQTHKRLMLLATISILAAAISRWPIPFMMEHAPFSFFAGVDLFVLLAIAYDLFSRHRVHSAYIWGGLLILASQPLRLMVSGTQGWLALADWLQH